MNQTDVKAENRKRILEAVAEASIDYGVSTALLSDHCGLCLRTTQTHLRALRDEGKIYNQKGFWFAHGVEK